MNKRIAIPIISVLAIILAGVLYAQEIGKLEDVQAEIGALEENVSALESNISALETELAELEVEVSAPEAELIVTFPDAGLEAAIREAIDKPEGPIYRTDLEALTTLEARKRDIWDLTGLEYCVNLLDLYLEENGITDISPLARLTNLETLALTNLDKFHLPDNMIFDISPLAGLTNLQRLLLGYNSIGDISPLVANSDFSAGDYVELWGNPLNTTSKNVYIPQLEARGVTVEYLGSFATSSEY